MENKLIVLVFLVLGWTSASAQKVEIKMDSTTHLYAATGVVQMDSMTANELYDKTSDWVAVRYKSISELAQVADKENSKLVCRGIFPVDFPGIGDGRVWHTLFLEFKEGRYRYTFTGFEIESVDGIPYPLEPVKIMRKKTLAAIEESLQPIISDLSLMLANKDNKKDNW